MHRCFILLVAPLFLFACADERATQPTDQPPFSAVQIDGQAFRAAKVSATNQTDLSIELSYAVRGGRAYIDAVTIDGVEYRSDCAGARTTASASSDDGSSGSSIPHYTYCEDGQGIRDLDFTCDGLRNPPNLPGPEDLRLKVEGNEELLRKRFGSAHDLGVFEPYPPSPGGYANVPRSATFNLTDGGDDFFRIELADRADWAISSTGETDTWGDLYKVEDDGSIKAIAGTGKWADRGNFAIQGILEAGIYYLRVSAEKGGAAGTYRVKVFGVLEDE